ncbi:hypothetical protein EX30DRAFT_393171 [Ascodesmis nigricans]|uniref:Uncharacterized protein n=1 Tax=Ascodesmis nigricans TaxID=341454 RepID=A0A4S2N3B4_9PEZI|nr:hypothetical protein EX30DRAFT_393171 [Ascodesmis nigricans]
MTTLTACAFTLSGTYSPTARYLFYALTLLCTVSRHATWLIGGTLAGSLLFSSIAVAHSFPLLIRPSASGVDLDVFPVFTITSVGALAAGPMLKWSSTVRESESAVRTVVAAWMIWCFVGAVVGGVAVRRTLDTMKYPVENCGAAGSNMREYQVPEMVELLQWREMLWKWSTAVMVLAGIVGIFGFFLGLVNRRRIRDEAIRAKILAESQTREERRRLKKKRYSVVGFVAPMAVRLSLVLAIVQVGVMERFMIGPKAMPSTESMKAVGSWGPLVGVGLGLIVGLMKAMLSGDHRVAREVELVEQLPIKAATEGPWWAVLRDMWDALQDASRWCLRLGVMRRRDFGLEGRTDLGVSVR